ncbi:S-acyl fatty acid synthase thioesterase, medium chain-like [Ptychodera flava]|uniref:S-acyl fatty acid synthase thioesterase, medium chain-like n=1 Tax=Ptychodera flava TaxID=63121 RepID=UPI00396A0FED
MSDRLVHRIAKPAAQYRLYCFPWAGGGAGFYGQWGKIFPSTVEVCSIRLPGRESRYGEPRYEDAATLVKEVTQTLLPEFKETPFAFFGHSMGAHLGFEIARYLKENHKMEPLHLTVSGTSAPHSELRKANTSHLSRLPDDEFTKKIIEIGGTPKEVSDNKELMKLFIPTLKSDFKLIENYSFEYPASGPVLTCPVTTFDGSEDRPHDMKAWGDLSKGDFSSYVLPGGHFYLFDKDNQKKLADYLTQIFHVNDAMDIV